MESVKEYLADQVLELSSNADRDCRQTKIIPRHMQLTIRNNEEMNKPLAIMTIAQGGVLPNIKAVVSERE